MNVHESILDKHGVAGGQVAAVEGLYTYHHYMQVSISLVCKKIIDFP